MVLDMKRLTMLLTILILLSAQVYAQKIINTEAEAQPIFENAKSFVASMKMGVPRQILLRLESPDFIKVTFSSSGYRTGESVQAFYQSHSPESIWMPTGLDETEFFATAVHELIHAWQSSECPPQDRSLLEGLASWGTVQAYGSRKQSQRAISYLTSCSKRDPVEGKVVNHLMTLCRNGGIDAVINYVKKETKFNEKQQ